MGEFVLDNDILMLHAQHAVEVAVSVAPFHQYFFYRKRSLRLTRTPPKQTGNDVHLDAMLSTRGKISFYMVPTLISRPAGGICMMMLQKRGSVEAMLAGTATGASNRAPAAAQQQRRATGLRQEILLLSQCLGTWERKSPRA